MNESLNLFALLCKYSVTGPCWRRNPGFLLNKTLVFLFIFFSLQVISELQDKDISEVIAEGSTKLACMPSGKVRRNIGVLCDLVNYV